MSLIRSSRRSPSALSTPRHRTAWYRKPLALLSALAMVLAMAVVGAASSSVANADQGLTYVNGINVTIDGQDTTNSTSHGEIPVVTDGNDLTIHVRYKTDELAQYLSDNSSAKLVITFTGMTATVDGSVSFENNDLIENSGTPWDSSNNTLTLDFADQSYWDAVENGHAYIKLTLNNNGDSELIEPEWKIGGEGDGKLHFISLADGDTTIPGDSLIRKTVDEWSKNATITPGADPQVSVGSGTKYDFTLRMFTGDELDTLNEKKIEDQLGDEDLSYVCDTDSDFKIKVTEWDSDGVPSSKGWTTVECSKVAISNSQPESFEFKLSDIPSEAWKDGAAHTQIPANTEIKLKYSVKVETTNAADNWKRDGKNLQEQYNEIWNGNSDATEIYVVSTNTATFPITVDSKDTAEVDIRLRAGLTPGAGFGKKMEEPDPIVYVGADKFRDSNGNKDLSSEGTLDDAEQIHVKYTLTANLAKWSEKNLPDPTDNVIITDVLPPQMVWDFDENNSDSHLKLTNSGSTSVTLGTGSNDCAADPSNAGDFCVDAQTLKINVGKNTGTNVTITALAKVTTFKDLHNGTNFQTDPSSDPDTSEYYWGKNTATDAIVYALPNRAKFSWGSHSYTTSYRDKVLFLVDLGQPKDEITDRTVFAKDPVDKSGATLSAPTVTFTPGEAATARYQFTITPKPTGVQEPRELNPEGLIIEDTISGDGADLFLLNKQDVDVTATYNGQTVDDSAFDFDINDKTITVKFIDDVWTHGNGTAVDKPLAHNLVVTLTLKTGPIQGKQFFDLADSARFLVKDPEYTYTDEITSASITSWGNEVSARKMVSDGGDWTTNLKVELKDDGTLEDPDKIYLYQLEVIPHGTYGNGGNELIAITDTWPSQMVFCGFVQGGSASLDLNSEYPSGCSGLVQTLRIQPTGGGDDVIVSTPDGGTGNFTVGSEKNSDSFKWDAEKPLYIYAAAKIEDTGSDAFVKNQPIVNLFGRSETTIVPTGEGDIPISIVKRDATATGDDPIQSNTAQTGKFQLWQGNTLIQDDIFLCNGNIRANGNDCSDAEAVTVKNPGNYEVYEIEAPEGVSGEKYVRAGDPLKIHVDEDGATTVLDSTNPAIFWNYPVDPGTVSVGDFVWWDKNHDGIQDDGEPGIEGVELVLYKSVSVPESCEAFVAEGELARTTTNKLGYYSFDGLDTLASSEVYVVCIDRNSDSTKNALRGFEPTLIGSEQDPMLDPDQDSSGWFAVAGQDGHANLQTDGQRDPSLDFGFYKPKPSGGGGTPPTTEDPETETTDPEPTPTTDPEPTTSTPTTSPSVPTVVPSSATTSPRPVPPTNVPPTTVTVQPNQCADIVERGFEPGETVTITVTGENGQYSLEATADGSGTVRFCLQADKPETITIEVLGENHKVVREVTIGVEGISYTGVNTMLYVSIALLLLAGGAGFMFLGAGRKRRPRGNHA